MESKDFDHVAEAVSHMKPAVCAYTTYYKKKQNKVHSFDAHHFFETTLHFTLCTSVETPSPTSGVFFS